VSDGLHNIIYDVYAQRDGNHQTVTIATTDDDTDTDDDDDTLRAV
jgi:hypothetical protein